jgi:hypothetical protein
MARSSRAVVVLAYGEREKREEKGEKEDVPHYSHGPLVIHIDPKTLVSFSGHDQICFSFC